MADSPIILFCETTVIPENICRCVGVIVKKEDGEILLIDRRINTLGWACPGGHTEGLETPMVCGLRELKEETGLVSVKNIRHVLSAITNNSCGRGYKEHYWEVFLAETENDHIELAESDKHQGIGWFGWEELTHLNLEPVWQAILHRLKEEIYPRK